MHSNSIINLGRKELESLAESLIVGVSSHLEWLAKINHSLVCNIRDYDELLDNVSPHRKCQFGQWYYHVNSINLLDDESFIKLGQLHKQMHIIASELLVRKLHNEEISDEHYSQFIAIQHSFFELLLQMSKNSGESLGDIDYLTGLPNRRAFNNILEKEKSRINRSEKGSSIAIADIDFFKIVNDTYGHDAGDKVLVEIAQCFTDSLREYDTVARFGGEEFIICLPDANSKIAKEVMERTRKKIECHEFDIGLKTPIKITCSIGICHFDKSFNPDKALSCADACLYEAKNLGRNKVVLQQPNKIA